MNSKIEIIYISGDGHSGSTLLDIILGSQNKVFSAGELINISRKGLDIELCSCGDKIKNCEVWKNIKKDWLSKNQITIDEHEFLKYRFERNKVTFVTIYNYFFPSSDYVKYCNSIKLLIESIVKITGNNRIIDSSKSPHRILIYRKLFQLNNIHLTRDFLGVLNSAKKSAKKDINKGYEHEINPRRTSKTLLDWIFKNILVEFFSIGVNSKKISYKKYINDHTILLDYNKELTSYEQMIFETPHMLAGNALRLKKGIKIFKRPESTSNLTKPQFYLAMIICKIFPFWS